jgi:hypothetical protein
MSIRCIKFRAYEKSTLRGFADFELTNVGIIIRDCPIHSKDGKEWVGFPARSFTSNTGETKWAPLVEFAADAKEAREQFQRQALAAVHDVTGDLQAVNETAKPAGGGSPPARDERIPFAPEWR